MKHLFTFIMLTATIGTSSADHRYNGSVLNLQLIGRGDFTVFMDGMVYPTQGSQLQIAGLPPGNHQLRVVENLRNNGYHGNYSLTKRVLFNGYVQVPAASAVFARMLPNGRLLIDRIDPFNQGYNRGYNNGYNYGGSCTNRGGGSDWYDDDDDYGGNRRGNYNNNLRGNNYGNYPQGNFMALRDAVSRASFDSDKLTIAGQYIRMNRISAAEVADVMRMLTYESSKLEFAKNAYAACYDKENYFLVNQAFTFSSSIRELNAFIR